MKPAPFDIVIVDDDPLQCLFWKKILERRHGERVRIRTYTDPVRALAKMGPEVSLVLLDWHMPDLDGKSFLTMARRKGLGPERFVIFSGSDAETLHRTFRPGECLAVIEKGARDQVEAMVKILDEVVGS